MNCFSPIATFYNNIGGRMKKHILNIGLMGAVFSFSAFAAAESVPFKSADFDFEARDILDLVPEEKVSANGDVMYCRADLSAAGEVERSSCFAKDSAIELVVETEQALKQLNFTAAEIDGEAIPVRMSFRVAYTPLSNATHVSLIPNLGTMQAQFGRDYVAPQQRLDVSDWYQSYSQHSYVGGQEFLGNGDMARVATTVSKVGKPTALKTVDAKRAHIRDADIVKRTLRDSRFIPGSVNGKVVPMEYVVAVHYGNATEAYADAK
jgi:hypothetical protein